MFNELLEKVTNEAVSGINEEVVSEHWNNTIGKKQLDQNETVRLVIMPSPTSNMGKQMQGKTTGAFTDKTQIRNVNDLINRMRTFSVGEIPGAIGFALSAGIYDYKFNQAPSYNDLKSINTMIIDIDAHINETSKDRFNLSTVDTKYLKFASVSMMNYINTLLVQNGLNPVTFKFGAVTGGGFQFAVAFNQNLDKQKSRKVFETFGSILGLSYGSEDKIKTQQQINKEIVSGIETVSQGILSGVDDANDTEPTPGEKSVNTDEFSTRKKKGLTLHVKDTFGNFSSPFFEIDNSFRDNTHAQRILGTINQKYNSFAYIDYNICKDNDYLGVVNEINQEIEASIQFNTNQKNKLKEYFYNSYKNFTFLTLSKNPECLPTLIDTTGIESLSSIIQSANSLDRHKGSDYIALSEVEKQVLAAINTEEKIIEVLQDLNISIVKRSSRYIACRSPFREDNNPSLAIYINDGKATIKDFTEDKNYNLITLWTEVIQCSKTEAIENMAARYNIKLDKSEKKDFIKLQQAETAMEYIQQIDVKDYLYYRLPNKIRTCVIKNTVTSKSFVFDGIDAIADHVLKNQLGYKHADKEFRREFSNLFEQYIIIDGFELFEPGADRIIQEDSICSVNIWSPNESYLQCWEESEKLEEMNLDEALELIKEATPAIYFYLLQITQKGNLKFLINWLNCLAKFKYVPIIPIFPSTQGAGKNLFATRIIYPYINQQYVSVVNAQQLGSNFNSTMGHSNLIIVDEGDFSNSRDIDNLKLLSGNDSVRIEKKGIDPTYQKKVFNICMFSNAEVPARHNISDRRFVYFKLDHSLPHSLRKLNREGMKTPGEFMERISEEVHKFWGIIIKTRLIKKWTEENLKNGIYYQQILKNHPFGQLVLKIIAGEWSEIGLQLNEKQRDIQEEAFNMKLLAEIKQAFYDNKGIPLIIINKYLGAMSWSVSTSIQQFIQINKLEEIGIKIQVDPENIKIHLDVDKLQETIYQQNNLSELIPEFEVPAPKTIEELRKEHLKDSKQLASSVIAPTKKMPIPGMSVPATQAPTTPIPGTPPPMNLPGGVPVPGGPSGLPGGIPNV